MGGCFGRAGQRQDALGNVTQVLDGRARAAGDTHDTGSLEGRGVGKVGDALDLDRSRAHDLAQPGQFLGVRAAPTADHDHEIHALRGLEGVLLPADRHRADGIDDLELVAPADHVGGEFLELPGRLRALADEGHLLASRDAIPVGLFVHDDGVRGETEQPDHFRVLGRPEQDDGVALVDELGELALLLDHPCARAIDDLEAAGLGTLHHLGSDAVCPDHDGGPMIDIVERLDGPDTQRFEVGDDPFVVDDLTERVRRLARCGRFLGLVDRLAHAIAEARALRDVDLGDGAHLGFSIARDPARTG